MSSNRGGRRSQRRKGKRTFPNRRGVARHRTSQSWGMTPPTERIVPEPGVVSVTTHSLDCPLLRSVGGCGCGGAPG
jgi:hypothetical protein